MIDDEIPTDEGEVYLVVSIKTSKFKLNMLNFRILLFDSNTRHSD